MFRILIVAMTLMALLVVPATAQQPPDALGIEAVVVPANPRPGEPVALEVRLVPSTAGALQLRALTVVDNQVVCQVHRIPPASNDTGAVARPAGLHLDLGPLAINVYHLAVFLDSRPPLLASFTVAPPPHDRPRLEYEKTGGFAGIHYGLAIDPDNHFMLHGWIHPPTVTNPAGGVFECGGFLTNDEAGRLAAIFENHHFADWQSQYGQGVPDGFAWRILRANKEVHVEQEGLPDFVAALVTEMDAFAEALARRCVITPPPPPPITGEIRHVAPERPEPGDVITITAGGTLPTSAWKLMESAVAQSGHEIRFSVRFQEDPTMVVPQVLVPWSATGTVGPLPAGEYRLSLIVNGQPMDARPLYVGSNVPPPTDEVLIMVVPPIPSASAPVALVVMGTFHEPRRVTGHTVEQNDHAIALNIETATMEDVFMRPINTFQWRVEAPLGLLEIGEYQVQVVIDGHAAASKRFQVVGTNGELPPGTRTEMLGSDVDSNGTVDYQDLLRIIRYWHVE